MTQFSKEEAVRFLAVLEKRLAHLNPDIDARLVGPVELAAFCREFISLIESMRELAEGSAEEAPPKTEYLLRALHVAQDRLDLAHMYVPFTEVMMLERQAIERFRWESGDLIKQTVEDTIRTTHDRLARLEAHLNDLMASANIR